MWLRDTLFLRYKVGIQCCYESHLADKLTTQSIIPSCLTYPEWVKYCAQKPGRTAQAVKCYDMTLVKGNSGAWAKGVKQEMASRHNLKCPLCCK